jgi:hypothetical protein
MEELAEEQGELVARVAALDIGKASLVCCVRVPHETRPGARRQEVRTYDTVTPALLELRDWLICQGVTRVVMEATSAYWKPPFYLLEDDIECWVVNARDVKNVPGRPKTDLLTELPGVAAGQRAAERTCLRGRDARPRHDNCCGADLGQAAARKRTCGAVPPAHLLLVDALRTLASCCADISKATMTCLDAWISEGRQVSSEKTSWTRSGSASWPSAACCGPALSPAARSGSCGT